MRNFLRRNLFIVVGLTLPLLLIGIVSAIQLAARWGTPPPEVAVLYVSGSPYGMRQFMHWQIERKKLVMRYEIGENAYLDTSQQRSMTLSLYDPVIQTIERFDVAIPAAAGRGDSGRLELPDRLQNLTLSDAVESPGGYRFEVRSGRRGGLFGELFGFGGYSQRFRLVRNGVSHELPEQGGYAYSGEFIGWVLEDDDAN